MYQGYDKGGGYQWQRKVGRKRTGSLWALHGISLLVVTGRANGMREVNVVSHLGEGDCGGWRLWGGGG